MSRVGFNLVAGVVEIAQIENTLSWVHRRRDLSVKESAALPVGRSYRNGVVPGKCPQYSGERSRFGQYQRRVASPRIDACLLHRPQQPRSNAFVDERLIERPGLVDDPFPRDRALLAKADKRVCHVLIASPSAVLSLFG